MTNQKLKGLEKAVDKKLEKEKKIDGEYRKQDEEYNQRVKEYRKRESSLKKEKLDLFKRIDKWAREFSSSGLFKKLCEDEDLLIYIGNWGHEFPRCGDYGCWSHVHLDGKGNLSYCEGYKWSGVRFNIERLDKNYVLELSYNYIKGFYDEIKSEEIYDRIRKYVRA